MSGIDDELAPVLGDRVARSDASRPGSDNTKIVLLNAPQLRSFCSNRAVTSNYTPLNFVPLALLQLLNPIEKFANFYFLVVGLMQMIPAITITDGRAGTFMPLSFVLLVDMLMRAIEDYSRHTADDATNTQQIDVLHTSPRGFEARWEAKQWHAVAVGDIVRVDNKGTFPADLLLLCASPERGSAWVNTKPLDGESDTKLRESAPVVPPIVEGLSEEDIAVRLGALRGVLVCEQPNDKVNDFSGQLRLATTVADAPWASCNLSSANMLLRGCQLRNTDAAYGLVVSTGNDCKINFSLAASTAGREKPGLMSTLVNKDIALVTVSLVVTCLIGASGSMYWNGTNSPWYLGLESSNPDSHASPLAAVGAFVIAVGRFFLLTYQFIPVSLYVSISVVNTINAYFVVQDISMYDAGQDEPGRVRSMALLEALGCVTHVFSDKTGTLTSNHMELRRLLIHGTAYGTGDTAISSKLRAQGYAPTTSAALTMPGTSPLFVAPPPDASSLFGSGLASCKPSTAAFVNYEEAVGSPSLLSLLVQGGCSQPGGSAGADAVGAAYQLAVDFLVNLAVNHSVMIERGGSEELVSSSPDELAFVSGAEYFGIELVSLDMQKRQVVIRNKLLGKLHTVELLEVFPYESSRKRMSVIVRLPEELAFGRCREVLYCKGADSVLLERLRRPAAEGTGSVKPQGSSVRASKSGSWWGGNSGNKTPGPIGDLRAQVQHLEEVLGSWAEAALRTLVFARRELPQFSGAAGADRFEAWHDAYVAQRNDPAAQLRMQAELECELTLQGATAIEDKLQDGVPEVLADLRDASVKVWMLTGDKVGTAKNIAAACNILSSEGEVSEFTEETHEGLKSLSTASLQALLDEHDGLRTSDPVAYHAKISAGLRAYPVVCDIEAQLLQLADRLTEDPDNLGANAGAKHSLVLDEKAIEVCCLCAPKLLARVSNSSRSVVACRARKDQKARLVSLIREEVPSAVSLAIGDGANDVAMIKAAHVGVGIIGKEGAQAVNNSDFGIGQFRFLRRLLFVHGRTISRRLSILVFYIFYKNVIETLVQFWYTTQAGWSGQTPFIQITINWFNMFYTSLPIICFAANDSDLARDHAERIPAAYRHSLRDPAYTHRRFWLWQLEALYFSLASYLLVVAALDHSGVWSVGDSTPGTFELGLVLQHVVITTVTLRLLLEVHAFTWLEWFFFIGTVVFWFANVAFFSEVDAPVGTCLVCWGAWNDSLAVLLSPYVVLVQGLTMAAVLAPRTTGKFWNVMRGSTLKAVRAKIQAAEAADCQLSHVRDVRRRSTSASVFGTGFAFSVNDESAAKLAVFKKGR